MSAWIRFWPKIVWVGEVVIFVPRRQRHAAYMTKTPSSVPPEMAERLGLRPL